MCFYTDNDYSYHDCFLFFIEKINNIGGKNDLLQKNNQQLEKVNQDLSQHYACLQEEITQRDLEIENLRKELASCRIDERAKGKNTGRTG